MVRPEKDLQTLRAFLKIFQRVCEKVQGWEKKLTKRTCLDLKGWDGLEPNWEWGLLRWELIARRDGGLRD